MIFAGHVTPPVQLEHLTHLFVPAEEPPTLSIEAAYRAAHALASVEYVMNITDDAIIPNGALDFLVARQREYPEMNIITGLAFASAPGRTPMPLFYHEQDPTSPKLIVYGMMKRSTSIMIGGVDKRFQALYWDCDRVMRLHQLGGSVINYDTLVASEREQSPNGRLSDRYSSVDRALLDWLWTEDRMGGKCSSVRLDSVQYFP
jgi:hypothetical protein